MDPAFTVAALGARVRVVIREGALTDAEYERLLDLWSACGSRETWTGAVDATVRRSVRRADAAPDAERHDDWPVSGSLRALTDRLSSEVTAAAIGAGQGRLLMLHAAALADPGSGRTLAFVGPSGTGKTTLSRRLARRLNYLSDETCAITPDGRVLPFRKPLSIRLADDGRPKRQVAPADLGLRVGDGIEPRLHRIVLLDRRTDAPGHPVIRPIVVTEAITALASETSYLGAMEAPLERLAVASASGGGAVRVTYQEAADLEDVVDELLGDGTAPTWVREPGSDEPFAASVAPAVARDGVIDAIADGAGVVVFVDGIVRRLDGIGPAIWRATTRPTPFSEVVGAVVDEFGEPGGVDADAVVRSAIDELADAGVLRWSRR